MEKKKVTSLKTRYFGQQQLQAIENFDVFDSKCFFLFYTLLKVSKQGISSSIYLVLIIIDLKMVTEKFLSLTDLFRAETLCIYKPLEVIIVDKHENFMLKALYIILLSLESLNNG